MPDPIKRKIKDNPSGETKWTTKGGTYRKKYFLGITIYFLGITQNTGI
jgi:uncharacterized membrane protein YkgB